MALTQGQRKCVETLDRPLVVAAGAGSGKTFTLTQRIVGALETGFVSDIDEVCAITFTKKAAAELKSRIKAELRARGLVEQALRVDEAWVSTIHGMCARILRAHAIELGIDPAFRVAEGAEVTSYMDQAVNSVLAAAQTEHSPQLDALFAEYPARSKGRSGVSVESMLSSIVNAASTQGSGADSLSMPGTVRAPMAIAEQGTGIVEDVFTWAENEKEGKTRNEWIAKTDEALQAARDAIACGVSDYESALRVVAPFKLSKGFGGKDYRAHVDESRVILGSCALEARLGAARVHLETIVMLARRVLDVFAALKRADGVLDNNDLLVMTARALEDYPSIAARYADKFKLVMVDEFQDTDQMQVDMIKRLAGEGATRLCTVGDAQQSIYRFRGADVSVYRKHLKSVLAAWPDSVINLSSNFRSHPDVLSFVDCVFEKPDMLGGEFMSLDAGRDENRVKTPFAVDVPRIIVQHTSYPSRGGVGSKGAVEVAARRIAEEFARLAGEGHSPNEMTVLLGRMANAAVYAQALRDCGLPCVVAGGSVFAQSAEAKIMAELTCVIANPLETQSLFNVLTSPLFALTADDLLAVGGICGFWRAAFDEAAIADPSPQLACALRVMADMRASIGRVPVSGIMEHVVTDSGWLSRLQGQGPEGLASAGNVFKALRIVHEIEADGAVGPLSVFRRFAEKLDGSKEAPGALSVSGGDSVRIMTIHASKGLEFPIVAVAEMRDGQAAASRMLASSVAGKVYLSLDLGQTRTEVGDTVDAAMTSQMQEDMFGPCADEETLASAIVRYDDALHRFVALRGFEAEGDWEEGKRLLYVAVTRAREALVVSSIGERTKDNPLGVPKSAVAGVFAALDPAGSAIGEGRTLCDFGGMHPAIVECVALTDRVDDGQQPRADEGMALDGGTDAFAIPVVEQRPDADWEPFKPLHQDVFSYSSISEASHEGDVLDCLAAAYAVSADVPKGTGAIGTFDAPIAPVPFGTSGASFDDDFWDFDVSQAFDQDRATDLGTAFHRLAQYAVAQHDGEGPLRMPQSARIEALARTCNLDGEQQVRLGEALKRWFGSKVANHMASLADVAPEVPFFVAVPAATDDGNVFLEGEIDLLGFDAAHSHATVVDYKTGGHDDESEEDLKRKHVLQAACYAYAIMLQGAESVDAVFVRVERPRADDQDEPQCVRYRFQKTDIPVLAKAIAEVYARIV